ncbi:MAG: tetratricopeptide repeat protein [Thermoguttaceae bacterium]
MRKRPHLRGRRSEASRGPSGVDAPRPKRWPLAVAVVVCVAVGAVLLERWSRPIDRPQQEHLIPNPQSPIPNPQSLIPNPQSLIPHLRPPIFPVPATDQELIAQTKKIGDRLVEDFPEDPLAVTLAGHICWALDEPAKARASWEKCTRLHPDCAVAWTALGMDALKQGDFEKAAQDFRSAYRLTPEMAAGDLFLMIDALMGAGRPEEVVAVLAPFRKRQPASVRAAVTLGQAYLQLKECEKAKQELLAAVALDPRSAQAHFALAQALGRLGDEPGAREHREEYAKLKTAEMAAAERMQVDRLKADVVELHPMAARFLTWTAEIYAAHGQVAEAERLWVTSLAVDPTIAKKGTTNHTNHTNPAAPIGKQ